MNKFQKEGKVAGSTYRGADIRLVTALWGKEPEEIQTCMAKMLRAIRAMESIYCEVFAKFLAKFHRIYLLIKNQVYAIVLLVVFTTGWRKYGRKIQDLYGVDCQY